MSFGCDILAISKLAWDVYNSYKDAPNDFRNISGEIKSLHIIVNSDNLKAIFQDPKLALEEREGLREILQGCTNVLEDLDKLLIKYKSLGSPQGSGSRALDRAKWGQEGIAEQRARLISNTTLLNTFVTNQIQTMLRKGLRRRNSTSSLHSIASFAGGVDSKETWKQLCRDLHKAGVTADTISERKDQIVGLFQDSGPPVVAEEVLKLQAESSTTLDRSVNLSKGANTDKKKQNRSLEIDQAPLKAYTGPLLIAAAKSGDINAARLRVTVAADLEYKNTAGEQYTALGAAALYISAEDGHLEAVKLLLEKGANIEATQSAGATALYIAAYNGHMEVVKLLLEYGANKEAAIKTGETALCSAAFSGHLEVVKLLLEEGANIDAALGTGDTALCGAAFGGHLGVVELLLEKGASIEAAISTGATALCSAAYRGHPGVVKLLLENGANIEASTDTGKTALWAAAYGGQLEVVRLLLEKGANREARSIDGETAVDIAARNGHRGVMELFTAPNPLE